MRRRAPGISLLTCFTRHFAPGIPLQWAKFESRAGFWLAARRAPLHRRRLLNFLCRLLCTPCTLAGYSKARRRLHLSFFSPEDDFSNAALAHNWHKTTENALARGG